MQNREEEGGVPETPSYSAGLGGFLFLFALDQFQQLSLWGFWLLLREKNPDDPFSSEWLVLTGGLADSNILRKSPNFNSINNTRSCAIVLFLCYNSARIRCFAEL